MRAGILPYTIKVGITAAVYADTKNKGGLSSTLEK